MKMKIQSETNTYSESGVVVKTAQIKNGQEEKAFSHIDHQEWTNTEVHMGNGIVCIFVDGEKYGEYNSGSMSSVTFSSLTMRWLLEAYVNNTVI